MRRIPRGKPTRRRQDSEAPKDRGASELCEEIVGRRWFIFGIPVNRDPVKKDLAVASNRDTPAVRTKGGEENVVMTREGIKTVLTIKGQNKIFGRAGGPTATKETQRGFMGE